MNRSDVQAMRNEVATDTAALFRQMAALFALGVAARTAKTVSQHTSVMNVFG